MGKKIIKVKLGSETYPIHIGVSLDQIGKALRPHKPSRVLVVTNSMIYRFHGSRLLKGLKAAALNPVFTMVPDGEEHKTLEQASYLYRSCLNAGLDRNSVIIGFGGGVIGDLTGFTGATYMRGVQVIHVPTTLLAMVDSSIGGKTGVDLPEGKNLVGSFYQPQMVWIDVNTLKTIAPEQWCNGMAEVIKYGVIADKRFFSSLEELFNKTSRQSVFQKLIIRKVRRFPFNLTQDLLESIISRSCAIKAKVVSEDEKEEKGLREILNFGHTFGHALETITQYRVYQHGEAVSVGMVMAARLAEVLHMFKEKNRLENILRNAGLPTKPKESFDPDKLINLMKKDKKSKKGNIRFVLPSGIGSVTVCGGIPEKTVKAVLKEFV